MQVNPTADDTVGRVAAGLVAACLLQLAGCETAPASGASAEAPRTICREEITGSSLPRCKRGDNTVTTSREDFERSGTVPAGGGVPPSSSATGRRPGL